MLEHGYRAQYRIVEQAQVIGALARKQVFQQHRGKGRGTAVTGDIRHEENHEVVADCEVVSEIATEIERGNHCVAENVVIEHQRRRG